MQYEQEVQTFFSSLSESEFETIQCPFHNEDEIPKHLDLFTKGSMQVVRCECDFVYNKHQPTQETLNNFYVASSAMDKWAQIKTTDSEHVRQSSKYGYALDYLANFKVNSVLDIGCGTGKFLSLLEKRLPLAKLVGVDQNLASIKTAQFKGVEIYHRSIFEFLETNEEKYEAITLWGVLEHVKDPIGMLDLVRERLMGPKIVVVCVPNVDSEIVQRTWKECFTFCPQHLWYFSRHTLERAFYQSGLLVRVNSTIEPEAIPILKHSRGLQPYAEVPEWATEQILPKSILEHMDRKILDTNTGYKIVAIGSIR